MKKKKKRTFLKVLLWIAGIIACFFVLLSITNAFACGELNRYIKSFDPVDYSAEGMRSLPGLDESTGYYTMINEDDIRIMVLSDLHIGGGISSLNRDKKTIYEVITMLQVEKPDLVILLGDNTFAVPGPIFNGGSSINNARAAKIVLNLFEHEEVYFTTVFGNHDTESFDFSKREQIGKIYEKIKYQYCIFDKDFSEEEAGMESISNQILTIKNYKGETTNILLLMDSNSYVDNSIMSSVYWLYDTVHQAQVDWAKESIEDLCESEKKSTLPVLAFLHIPIGEYQVAYKQLEANNWQDTEETEYISGVWKESVNLTLQTKIFFGGCSRFIENPEDADSLFETLGPDGLNCLEAVFCGHDHTNTGVLKYKGVYLEYNNSMDNSAYTAIQYYGLQRGCTRITIHTDGTWEEVHLNAYQDLGVSTTEFVDVSLEKYYGE